MNLPEKLILLRKGKGLTQMKVAEALDVSRQAIFRWESGDSVPSTENLRILSELYGVTIDYLIAENSEVPIQKDSAEDGHIKKQKWWGVWTISMLIVAVFIITLMIGTRDVPEKPKIVNFDEIDSEDWGDASANDIPIEW